MKNNVKKTPRYWGGLTLSAVALIFIGILVVLFTFLTIIGPIFGLILIAGGVYLLTLASQAKTRDVGSTAGQEPVAEERSSRSEERPDGSKTSDNPKEANERRLSRDPAIHR